MHVQTIDSRDKEGLLKVLLEIKTLVGLDKSKAKYNIY